MQKKWMAATLAAAVMVQLLAAPAFIQAKETKKTTNKTETDTKTVQESAKEDKQQIFVFCTSDGSANKVMLEPDLLADLNLSGKQDGLKVTDIDGKAITVKGSMEDELPMNMDIVYEMDGKQYSASEMAGKKGHFKVTWKMHSAKTVKMDGKTTAVPCVVISAALLDADTMHNVKAKNAQVSEEKGKLVLSAITFPGVKDTIKEASLPVSFSLEGDTDSFAMPDTLHAASSDIFDLPTKGLSTSQLAATLQEKAGELLSGSSQLADGTAALVQGAKSLDNGAASLVKGSSDLTAGSVVLDQGAASMLQGTGSLSSGLSSLSASSQALLDGASALFASVVSTGSQELHKQLGEEAQEVPDLTTDNYNQVLDGLIGQMGADEVYDKAMTEARKEAQAQVDASSDAISAQVTAQVEENVTAQVESQVQAQTQVQVQEQVIYAATGMSVEDYEKAVEEGKVDESTQAQINSTVQSQMESESTKAMMEAQTKVQVQAAMESEETAAIIAQNIEATKASLVEQAVNCDEVQAQIAAKVQEVSAAAAKVSSLKGSLNQAAAFVQGLQAYTGGVAQAASGAAALHQGMQSLKNGTASLTSGASQLQTGMESLQSGTTSLYDGLLQLESGSDALLDGVGKGFGKVEDLAGSLETLQKVLDKASAGKNTEITYIYKTAAIAK